MSIIDTTTETAARARARTPEGVLEIARESQRTTKSMLSLAVKTLAKAEGDALRIAASAHQALDLPVSLLEESDHDLLTELSAALVRSALGQVRQARASVDEWTRNLAAATETVAQHEIIVAGLAH